MKKRQQKREEIESLSPTEAAARSAIFREAVGVPENERIDLNDHHNGFVYGLVVMVWDAAKKYYETGRAE